MGLSIAYHFEFQGTKDELMRRLKRLREEFQRLPVRSVGDIVEIGRLGNGVSFLVDIKEGCEHFQVIMGRLGRGRTWHGVRTTKTQYAKRFVESHLTVIRMLELCQEVGILGRVSDDGHYWETRDLAVLAERLNASEEMLRVVAAALTTGARIRGLDCHVADSRRRTTSCN